MLEARTHVDARPTRWVPVVLLVLALITAYLTVAGSDEAQGASSVPDKIVYVQTTGSGGTYLQYVPGDGSTVTKQSVTSGGVYMTLLRSQRFSLRKTVISAGFALLACWAKTGG